MTAFGGRDSRWALLLLDYQYDFLDVAGRMPVARGHVEQMLTASQEAIGCALRHGAVIVEVANAFPRGQVIRNQLRRSAALVGTPGASWDPRVAVPGAVRLQKSKPSAFSNPGLQSVLDRENVGVVAVAGLYARACVSATVTSALRRGLRTIVLEDALACRTDHSRAAALNRMAARGAHVCTVDRFAPAAGDSRQRWSTP